MKQKDSKQKDGKALYQIALLESLQQKFVQHRISKGYFDLFCAGHFPLLPCQAQFPCSSMLDTYKSLNLYSPKKIYRKWNMFCHHVVKLNFLSFVLLFCFFLITSTVYLNELNTYNLKNVYIFVCLSKSKNVDISLRRIRMSKVWKVINKMVIHA